MGSDQWLARNHLETANSQNVKKFFKGTASLWLHHSTDFRWTNTTTINDGFLIICLLRFLFPEIGFDFSQIYESLAGSIISNWVKNTWIKRTHQTPQIMFWPKMGIKLLKNYKTSVLACFSSKMVSPITKNWVENPFISCLPPQLIKLIPYKVLEVFASANNFSLLVSTAAFCLSKYQDITCYLWLSCAN